MVRSLSVRGLGTEPRTEPYRTVGPIRFGPIWFGLGPVLGPDHGPDGPDRTVNIPIHESLNHWFIMYHELLILFLFLVMFVCKDTRFITHID